MLPMFSLSLTQKRHDKYSISMKYICVTIKAVFVGKCIASKRVIMVKSDTVMFVKQ